MAKLGKQSMKGSRMALSTQPVNISWAEDSDNQKILQLSPRCIQSGIISVYIDRSPVFNRIHSLLDTDSYHTIAKAGDRIVGLFGTIHLDLFINENPYRTVYFMDFRVDPDYQ